MDKQYGTGGGIDDVLSRIAKLRYNATDLATMTYLGAGTVVEMDYVPGEVKYRLNLGTGDDPYTGMDRFDRIVDLVWRSHASTDLERMKYGYDRASNRLWMERLADTNHFHDELYTYDGMHRLKTFKRGTLNAAHSAITTLKFAQEWGLDSTGNWATFKEDANGDATWDLDQSRTSNKGNEITAISETSGPSWTDPTYGRAGVMTTVPKPADPTGSFSATYDAWERLVKLMDGANTVVTNAYDGFNRLVVKGSYTLGVLTETRHSYYNSDWQCLEERVGVSTIPDRHLIWGVRYIDDLICDVNAFVPSPALNRFALNDVQFSVYALVGPDDRVHERVRYAPFAKPTFLDGAYANESPTSPGAQKRLFAGYNWSTICGNYDVRNRVLNSLLGTFYTRDPLLRFCKWTSAYLYVSGRPTSYSDPSGYLAESLIDILRPITGFRPRPFIWTPVGFFVTCLAVEATVIKEQLENPRQPPPNADDLGRIRPPRQGEGSCEDDPVLKDLPNCSDFPETADVTRIVWDLFGRVKCDETAATTCEGEHYSVTVHGP